MSGFGDQIRGFTKKTNDNIDKTVQYSIILAAQGVILKSPVDTGRFRANWQFGIDVQNTTTTETTDKSGRQTLGGIMAQVRANVVGDAARGVFWISNSLPYGHRLEFEGWSKQAPAGMVRITLAELPGAVDAYVRTLQ
ncbi:HK97 gp10 family phage protein [Variovorax ginsengisoli]|uniref:HK97 gp10 family phage protein n=1 Tax=Variovorax ginsengisoli TaxID=363844 RepID=A0ABT8S3N4_9BURK|nr:HK97 gp10 family phage protein [Variovorax ginsengisoli]MDN8612796.1 HK97 gp10 family phage protein [Variovorax ginsengisoli]MDO1531966.1 HK97 gp10 family phage protein [Variovorax ginsengisoli]